MSDQEKPAFLRFPTMSLDEVSAELETIIGTEQAKAWRRFWNIVISNKPCALAASVEHGFPRAATQAARVRRGRFPKKSVWYERFAAIYQIATTPTGPFKMRGGKP